MSRSAGKCSQTVLATSTKYLTNGFSTPKRALSIPSRSATVFVYLLCRRNVELIVMPGGFCLGRLRLAVSTITIEEMVGEAGWSHHARRKARRQICGSRALCMTETPFESLWILTVSSYRAIVG